MALQDRLRNQELAMRLSHNSPPEGATRLKGSPSAEDTIYDLTEYKRMKLALDELRFCCRSDKALKSFEHFETQLRKKREHAMTNKRSNIRDDRSCSGSDELDMHKSNKNFASMKSKLWWPAASEPTPTADTVANLTSNLQKKPYQPQLSMSARPGLVKSQTTGNLALLGTSGNTEHCKAMLQVSDSSY